MELWRLSLDVAGHMRMPTAQFLVETWPHAYVRKDNEIQTFNSVVLAVECGSMHVVRVQE